MMVIIRLTIGLEYIQIKDVSTVMTLPPKTLILNDSNGQVPPVPAKFASWP